MTSLCVPEIDPDDDPLTAALKYADAGWYVLPVTARTKHAGSVVGVDWPSKSSRDPQAIVSWFAGTSGLSIALHVGRSGAIAVDVDNPEVMTDLLANACARTVHQSTRDNATGRGHYLFAMPPGRDIGNSNGTLGKDWGEIRGKNGIIIVAPSSHEKAADGGRYQWVGNGPLPELPAEIAALLPDAADAKDAATDAQVAEFLDEHIEAANPELLAVWCAMFTKEVQAGASRHQSMVSKLSGAMKEARAGFIDARTAAETLQASFLTAVGKKPKGKQGAPRVGAAASNEWHGILAWAVAQAKDADLVKVRARVAQKMPDVGSSRMSPSSSSPATKGDALPPMGETQEDRSETLHGAELLDRVEAMLARFVAFPSEPALIAATLWAAHTHAIDAFDTSPRLAFLSPEPGSGKTRALEILELLVVRPLLTVNVTPAYLFRKVADEAGPPTILYDEIDTVFGPKAKDNEEIRGMLNSGYRKGATAGRCAVKGNTIETEELPSYAAVALAGLDDLPDTIMSRSIVVRMRRRAPHERIEPYRRRTHGAEGYALRDQLAAWVNAVGADLQESWPDLPSGIEDRNADVWEPLLAIADAAGGHWPKRGRGAAVGFVTDAQASAGGFGVQLLADLRTVFGNEPSMSTEAIIEALCAMDESPWADIRGKELDARGLSRRLGKYGIKPKVIRVGNKTPRGYDRADLHDSWVRYLPEKDASPVGDVADVADARAKGGGDVALPIPISTSSDPTHLGKEDRGATTVGLSPPVSATSATAQQTVIDVGKQS